MTYPLDDNNLSAATFGRLTNDAACPAKKSASNNRTNILPVIYVYWFHLCVFADLLETN